MSDESKCRDEWSTRTLECVKQTRIGAIERREIKNKTRSRAQGQREEGRQQNETSTPMPPTATRNSRTPPTASEDRGSSGCASTHEASHTSVTADARCCV